MARNVAAEASWNARLTSVPVEERGAVTIHRRHDERAVEEVVSALARALGEQQAAMAGRAMEIPILLPRVGLVLRAHGIVRAKLSEIDGLSQIAIDPVSGFHQPTKRALCVRARGVEKDAVACLTCIDALSNRTGGIRSLRKIS